MNKFATVLLLPYGDDGKPIFSESKPIAIPIKSGIFSAIAELDALTKQCFIVFNSKVYLRSRNRRPILDVSGDDLSYAIHITEVPNPEHHQEEQLDIDANGKPKLRLIKGGLYDGKDAA